MQRKYVLASIKGLQLIEVSTPAIINHLSGFGAVCFCPCFCVQQQKEEFVYSGSCKRRASKWSSCSKSQVPLWFASKLFKKKVVCWRRLFSRQIFVLSSYQALNFLKFLFDGVETGILQSDYVQQLRRKNSDVLDFYFTLLDVAGVPPSLILNQNAKAKERGSWIIAKM